MKINEIEIDWEDSYGFCQECGNNTFQIGYGEYECFGRCTKCGNIQSLYSG